MVNALTLISTTYLLERSERCPKKVKKLLQLAWNLLSKICAHLIEYLKNILSSQEFLQRNRVSSKDFTRKRTLHFDRLVVFLINFIKGSYQDEADHFFQVLLRLPIPKRLVTKVAVAKARMKLKYEAFIELNRHLISFFQERFTSRTWHGFRLLAFDGSTLRLPHEPEIIEHFGTWKVRKGQDCPMARVSQMFDTLNRVSVDTLMAPKSIGERQLAQQHCAHLLPTDLVLLDRGYPASWLFKLIMTQGAHFCSRISAKWKVVKKFYHSGLPEQIISLRIAPTSVGQCRKLGLDTDNLSLRLIRIPVPDGQDLLLITSLTDSTEYPYELFMELYHERWPVEEDYKVMKCWLEMENFTGKSVLSVYQDFHAKVFSKNLTSVLAFPLHDKITEESASKKYRYKINFAQALSKAKNTIVLLFQRTRARIQPLLSDLHEILAKTTEAVRPGRSFPRNHKVSRRKFFINYKPIS